MPGRSFAWTPSESPGIVLQRYPFASFPAGTLLLTLATRVCISWSAPSVLDTIGRFGIVCAEICWYCSGRAFPAANVN
jgi:hypothetical protein